MSSKKRIILTVLCIIGLILSFDLVYIYIKTSFMENAPKSFCSINAFIDCDGVSRADKAFVFGVPLAIWGVILYLLFLFLTWIDKIREKIKFPILDVFENPQSYIASIGLFSFCVSMTLACISIFDIQKICILCFMTYFINLFIALTAVQKNLFITDIKNTFVDFYKGARKYLIVFLLFLVIVIPLLAYLQKSLVLAPNLRNAKEFKEFQEIEYNPWATTGNTLGNPDGDVQIYIYGDFMCQFCRIMNYMLHKLASEDKQVAVYHSNYPLDSACNPSLRGGGHQGSCLLAQYALAAKKQGNYWGMVSGIYDVRPKNENDILALALALKLNPEKLRQDAYSDETKELLEQQVYRGINEHLIGTPTIYIDGIPHIEIMSYSKLKELVKQTRIRHAKQKSNS